MDLPYIARMTPRRESPSGEVRLVVPVRVASRGHWQRVSQVDQGSSSGPDTCAPPLNRKEAAPLTLPPRNRGPRRRGVDADMLATPQPHEKRGSATCSTTCWCFPNDQHSSPHRVRSSSQVAGAERMLILGVWLWFRDRPKLKSLPQQRDIALASAGMSDGPAQGMHTRMRRAADLALVVRSGPSRGGARIGG
jgi:hypothetical protein